MSRRTPIEISSTITDVLAELPVGKEATTSRVVVDNNLLRVVYFSFDAGQELTDHATPRAVVVTLLTGAMDFTVGEVTARLAPGDVVYLAPGQTHALVATAPSHLSLVMVAADQ